MSAIPVRIFLNHLNQAASLLRTKPASLISIVGPTGSGKTKLALELADRVGPGRTLLVSVDSVALYRDLNIGSAKPLGSERKGYEWIGIDTLALDQSATSSAYVDTVLPAIEAALVQSKSVVVVGGSHFYERALCVGRMPGEASNAAYQNSLTSENNQALHRRLVSIDPRFGQKIDLADRYRITRYLDLAERQGLTYDELQAPKDQRSWKHVYTLSTSIDDDLDARTEVLRKRTSAMFAAGWVGEVKALLDTGARPDSPGLQTIGYRDVVKHLLADVSENQTFENIVIAHRQLAKVQRTWIRGLQRKSSDALD